MRNRPLYYSFREVGRAEGPLIVLHINDRSTFGALNPAGHVVLTADGVAVATTMREPSEIARKSAPFPATAVIEVPVADVTAALAARGMSPGGMIRFECLDDEGGRLTESALFGLPTATTLPLPDAENMVRVAGGVGPRGFEITGAGWYVRLLDLFARETGRPLAQSAAVLDWGVGCARIARFFLADGHTDVTGIDIDAVNIDWCNANLLGALFERNDFDPPTRFPDGAFDLVYGHSVFTHLDAAAEAAWLAELARLLAPGGMGCVTIGSEYGMTLANRAILDRRPAHLSALWTDGRADMGAQGAPGVDAGRAGYYRLVHHTTDYVRRAWSPVLGPLRIIHGFAENQDAVVFTRR